jgi:hypothetical protein
MRRLEGQRLPGRLARVVKLAIHKPVTCWRLNPIRCGYPIRSNHERVSWARGAGNHADKPRAEKEKEAAHRTDRVRVPVRGK